MSKKYESKFPFVSICTPTFNRRPFIPYIIKCFEHQTYPRERMEWIILDDGTDKIEDLVKHIPQVKYFKYDEKMKLGRKRNLMHEKCKGNFIVYIDDDDYYPPERVSHAIETLQKNPNALCAGSSTMFIYFKHVQKMYQFGPYGPNHATAATFAFRKELLKQTAYDNDSSCSEETTFLKQYSIPFVQLDPMKCILVVSHIHNSLDKKILLEDNNPFVKESPKRVDDFIKELELKKFFIEDIETLLPIYDQGKIENKPDVMKQVAEIMKKREQIRLQHQQQHLSVQNMIQNYEKTIHEQNNIIQEIMKENRDLREKMQHLDAKLKKIVSDRISEVKGSK